MARYELRDTVTWEQLGCYQVEASALAVVADLVLTYGPGIVVGVVLVDHHHEYGDCSRLVAEGTILARRAARFYPRSGSLEGTRFYDVVTKERKRRRK